MANITSSVPEKQLNVTELDFDQIKKNLKDYFKSLPESPFTDWDYEGSGVNLLLSILAYNTHYNAMLAHMTFNEGFIDSAQLRSSVVSQAKLLGYTPRSRRSAKAVLTLVPDSQTSSILRGTVFNSTDLNGNPLTFVTKEEYPIDDSQNLISNVEVFEGVFKTKRYAAGSTDNRQAITIDDSTIDTSTLVVRVYENGTAGGTSYTTFVPFTSFANVTGSTPVYFISENVFGKYEISFGDNVIGKQLTPMNIVEIEYISTSGAAGNGAGVFTESSNLTDSITVIQVSSGGTDAESIDSVRFNAPKSLITQNRAVTVSDYRAIILEQFGTVDAINVWSGDEEALAHPDMDTSESAGKAYICIKPENAEILSESEKTTIRNILNDKRVFTVQTIFKDPEYTRLYFDIYAKYDGSRTSLPSSELNNIIIAAIKSYNDSELQNFGGVFRHSKFLRAVDNSDIAFVNSVARIYFFKTFVSPAVADVTTINFPSAIYCPHREEEGGKPCINSTGWDIGGTIYYLKDGFNTDSDNVNISLRHLYVSEEQSSVVSGSDILVGTINVASGVITFNLDDSDVRSYFPEGTTIDIHAQPESDDVAPNRNQLLTIDMDKTSVITEKDTIVASGNAGASTYFSYSREGVLRP